MQKILGVALVLGIILLTSNVSFARKTETLPDFLSRAIATSDDVYNNSTIHIKQHQDRSIHDKTSFLYFYSNYNHLMTVFLETQNLVKCIQKANPEEEGIFLAFQNFVMLMQKFQKDQLRENLESSIKLVTLAYQKLTDLYKILFLFDEYIEQISAFETKP